MSHVIYLSDEELRLFTQLLPLIGKIIQYANLAKYEEEHEKHFNELAAELRQQKEIEDKTGFLKFTEKEILKMPMRFRKIFRANGCLVRVRRRKRSKNGYDYEARYRREGYNITVSSKRYEDLTRLFIAALARFERETEYAADFADIPTSFEGFAEYYLIKIWKRRVTPETFKNEMNRYKKHIKPYFGSIPIKRVTSAACQALIDKITDEGHGKTADEVFTRLNMIFEAAIKHLLIKFNPLDLVTHIPHERENGVPLTKDEERYLIESTAGTPLQLMFIVPLYTGLRPCEYKTARIEGDFIVSVNAKRKTRKVEYKKIPITPMLRPYLEGVQELKFYVPQRLREKFREILPNHSLKDLRTTFSTRCVECGVSNVARELFLGHSLGRQNNAYIKLDDDYLKSEGEKFRY